VLVSQSRGTGYWLPRRGVYIRPSSGSWQVTQDVITDEDLQIAEGNSSGAQYSGAVFSILDDPSTDTIHRLGDDAAWWATRCDSRSTGRAR